MLGGRGLRPVQMSSICCSVQCRFLRRMTSTYQSLQDCPCARDAINANNKTTKETYLYIIRVIEITSDSMMVRRHKVKRPGGVIGGNIASRPPSSIYLIIPFSF